MKLGRQILSGFIMMATLSFGPLVFAQKKNDQKVPDKEKTVTVPVTPKNNGNNNDQGNGKKRP
jgi:hypothetical protein